MLSLEDATQIRSGIEFRLRQVEAARGKEPVRSEQRPQLDFKHRLLLENINLLNEIEQYFSKYTNPSHSLETLLKDEEEYLSLLEEHKLEGAEESFVTFTIQGKAVTESNIDILKQVLLGDTPKEKKLLFAFDTTQIAILHLIVEQSDGELSEKQKNDFLKAFKPFIENKNQ